MQNGYARTRIAQLHHRRRVWLPVCPLSRSKIILRGPFGSSVIENWEVVRSSEACNVCKLC